MASLKYKTQNGYVSIPVSMPGNVALIENTSQGNTPFVPAFDPETESVRITPQTLTSEQKAQARTNIGAAESVDTSSFENKVEIEEASGSTLSAQVGKYYRFDSAVSSLAVTLPTISNATTIQGCVFYLTTGSSISLTFTGGGTVKYQDGYEIKASSTYEINAIWNGAVWVIASIKIA